jgi:hypothetical protein
MADREPEATRRADLSVGGRFLPARIRDLGPQAHVVVLFCLLVNVWVCWHFYTPLHDNGWGDWDDHTWRRDTERRNSWETILDPFLITGAEAMDTSYVPVQSFVYHWSVNIVGQGPFPIRVVGIWLHALNACLLLLVAFRFTRSIPASHLASLAFILFPRNAYAIGWLCASLAHGLVWLLYLLAFLALQSYLHERGWWRLLLGSLLFLVGMLTKELVATLVAAMILYDVLVVRGLRSLWPPKLRVYLGYLGRHAPLLAILAGALFIQTLKYETGFVSTKFGGVAFGVRPLLRTVELLSLLAHWGPGWPRETLLLGMGGVAAALLAAVYLFRRRPVLLFLTLWLPLVVTPMTISNFRDVHRLGRYVYEASAVLALLLAVAGVVAVRARRYLAWPLLCAAGLLLAHFAILDKGIIR